MKATLEFDLMDYSERLMHRRAANADNAYLAISDICDMLRRERKCASDPELETIETVLENVSEILDKHGISLNEDIE